MNARHTPKFALWCVRCGIKAVAFDAAKLERYDRESKVVLCWTCERNALAKVKGEK